MKSKLLITMSAATLMFTAGVSANTQWSFGKFAKDWTAPAPQFQASAMRELPATVRGAVKTSRFNWEKGLSGKYRYIVRLSDEPLASYRGGVDGLQATNPDTLRAASRTAGGTTAASGNVKLNTRSAASVAYLDYLARQQTKFEAQLTRVVASPEVLYRYKYAFNGMTVSMTQEEAARVSQLSGVVSVQRDFMRQINTADSTALIGAPSIWDGSATGGLEAKGEGVLIGIIDTGINTDHPAFAEVSPGDGYVHTNPLGAGVFLRDCAPYNQTTNPNGGRASLCNSKLIGTMALPESAASVMQEDAEDWNGHGSHTAGTAGGNFVPDVPFVDFGGNPTGIVFDKISGVAPRANIAAYMACGDGGCPGSDLVAAIDAATADGVDVINYSIGGGPIDPWNDSDSLAFLGSRDAGIFVATSASNDGPGPGTVGSPAVSPWLTSVAANTHQRRFSEKFVADLSGGNTTPPDDIPGRSASGSVGLSQMVYAGDFGDELCALGAFAPGTFNGEIVLCDRGAYALVDKAQAVATGGAGGVIIATTASSSQTLFDIPYVIPGIQIDQVYGDPLREWLSTGTGHMGRITAAAPEIDFAAADVVIDFSGRGPNASVPDIISPSLSAPGVDVYAPLETPTEYGLLSGTSMSSPHVAGAGALMRQLHPEWSAAEIHTALSTTGLRDMTRSEDGEGATPFDSGGGRIQLELAANAGLLMHETTANFQAANPQLGGDPKSLNIPSFANSACLEVCTWERTVKATTAGTWTASSESSTGMGIEITPSSFTLGAGDTQVITVAADVQRLPFDEWVFGWVLLTPDDNSLPVQSMPVAVSPTAAILPERLRIEARRDAGSQLVGGFRTGELAGLELASFGLAAPEERVVLIEGDNGGEFDPYTGVGVAVEMYDVAPGAVLFSARTSDSTAVDIDLFVGRDNNGDGEISIDEELCQSGNPDDNELCELTGDAVSEGGRFWVAVLNFEASAPGALDETLLTVAIAEPSTGGLSAETPASIRPGEPWDIRILWDADVAEGETLLGAVEIRAEGSGIALIPVELVRIADDVRVSASATDLAIGDVVDMVVEVEANLSPEDLFYVIDADIPDGFEYVAGSADASLGDVYVINNMLIWVLTHPTLATVPRNYVPSVNGPGVDTSNPLYNAACDTGFGGYINLSSFGINPNPSISGNNVAYFTLDGQNLPYFDKPKTGFTLTDDGFGVFSSGLGATPWQNTAIPDDAEPNDMIAMAWTDLEIVYDAAAKSGVTISAPGRNLSVIEYDDMQRWPAGSSTDRIDFEVILNGSIDDRANKFEIVLAYDNIEGDWSDVTTGLENQAGTLGTQYDGQLSDGLMICYDYQGPDLSNKTLSYQMRAMPGAAGEVTHKVFNIVDNPGSREASTSVSFNLAADTDSDGISDDVDNCAMVSNPDQTDSDNDGFGNACDADFNQDMKVDFLDLSMMSGFYMTAEPVGDLNNDGWVDMGDLNVMRDLMFTRPGPSGFVN